MAFTGTATITQISDRIVRITGLSLTSGSSGTIALAAHTGATPDVVLPAAFKTEHYTYLGHAVSFQDCIEVTAWVTDPAGDHTSPIVQKTGTTTADFRSTIVNAFGSTSTGMEIYVKLHD